MIGPMAVDYSEVDAAPYRLGSAADAEITRQVRGVAIPARAAGPRGCEERS